jgi:hypothetical protein
MKQDPSTAVQEHYSKMQDVSAVMKTDSAELAQYFLEGY